MKKTTFIVFFVYTVVILLGSFLLKGFAFFPTAVNLLTGLLTSVSTTWKWQGFLLFFSFFCHYNREASEE